MNLNKAINAGQDANDDLAVNGPTYGDYQNDKDKVEDILNNGISSDKTEIAIGNNGVMERRGYFMRQIQGGSGALKILEDKILFSEDGTFADYKTAISSKGVWAETVFGILLAGETLEIKNTGNNFKVDENGLTMENQAGNFAITADGVRINELDLMLTRGNSRITLQNYFDMTSENNPSEPQTTPMLIEKKVGGIWTPVFRIDENGNVILNDLTANNGTFQGILNSSQIYSTKIIGMNKAEYEVLTEDGPPGSIEENPDIFVEVGQRGIRLLKRDDLKALQKFGLTVGSIMGDENVIFTLGAGTREGDAPIINGVRQYNGCFIIDKGEGVTTMGISGGDNFIYFYTGGSYDGDIIIRANTIRLEGNAQVNGDRIATEGRDITPISNRLNNVDASIANLERRIAALESQQGSGV